MNIWEVIILFFAPYSLCWGMLISLSKKGSKKARVLWLLFSLLFSYNIFYNVLYWSEFNLLLLKKLALLYLIPLSLYGPIIYLYNRIILGKRMPKWHEMIFHLLPCLAIFLLYGPYLILPIEERDRLKELGLLEDSVLVVPFVYSTFLSILLLAYTLGSYYLFLKNRRSVLEGLTWIKALNVLFICFGISWVLYHFMVYKGLLTIEKDYLITGVMILIIVLNSYLVYKRPEVLYGWEKLSKFFEYLKYKNSGLTREVSLEYKKKLERLMESERPYLNPDFKLNDLAELLGLSRHHTSQLINEHFHSGFFDFINYYRISTSCSILLDLKANDPKETIIEAAYKAGFNSKSSFYKAFKKFVGTTPSHYIKDPN